MAKRDLKAGEKLDGVGGFCAYGLIENRAVARDINALPIAMSEDCVMLRDVAKDQVVGFDDVRLPPARLIDRLWQEQLQRWPSPRPPASGAANTKTRQQESAPAATAA